MLSYYLNHEKEVREYCRRQEEAGKAVVARIEAAQGPVPGAEKVRAAKCVSLHDHNTMITPNRGNLLLSPVG